MTYSANSERSDSIERSVPVVREKYSLSKKVLSQEFVIEKRWVTKTKTVRFPITYEEIYVNGKRFNQPSALASLFGREQKIVENKRRGKANSNDIRTSIQPEGKNKLSSTQGKKVLQQILPLYGERIRITKKMIRYADAVITKTRSKEMQKVKIELAGEKVMIRYPDGTERTLESTALEPTPHSATAPAA